MKTKESGFTIVELLIVIVVIGILAAITIVAYNGVSAKATDSRRKSELNAIAKVFLLHAQEHNDGAMMGLDSGCGYMGRSTGYFGGRYTNSGVEYPSIRTCLADAGYRDIANFGSDSDGYMKLDCSLNGVQKKYALAPLATEPARPNMIEELCNPATSLGWGDVSLWDERYGMNYYLELQ